MSTLTADASGRSRRQRPDELHQSLFSEYVRAPWDAESGSVHLYRGEELGLAKIGDKLPPDGAGWFLREAAS